MDILYYGWQKWDFSGAPACSDSDRINFVIRNTPTLTNIDPESANNKGRYSHSMFTCLTQHIKGKCFEDLIDAGIYAEKNKPLPDNTPVHPAWEKAMADVVCEAIDQACHPEKELGEMSNST